MNFDLGDEQVALRDGVRRFLGEQYAFESWRRRLSAACQTDRTMWTQFGELGWLGMLVPEACGGLGLKLQDAMPMLQEFGYHLVAEPYLDGAVLAVQLLARSDSPLARALLPALATGDALLSVAMLESNQRYRLDTPQTLLVRKAGTYRLSGRKLLVEGGDVADGYLVLARYEGDLALIYVPATTIGVARNGYRLLDGGWGSDVTFTDVAIDDQWLLATGAPLIEILARSLDEAALGAAAQAVGCMDRVLELATEYLGTRKQFGRTLASFQVLQHRIVDLFVDIEMARSACYGALSAIDREAAVRSAAVSAGRVRVDQAALRVGTQGIHVHGGVGMTMEYPMGHCHRKLLRLTRLYGDTTYHLARYERLQIEAGD